MPTSSSSSVDALAQPAPRHALDAALQHQVLAAGRVAVDARAPAARSRSSGARASGSRTTSWPATSARPSFGVVSVVSTCTVVDLPGAVRPEQAEDLALAHAEGDAVERLHLAVALLEPLDDDRVHGV